MSDLLTHIRRFEMVEVDLDKEPQCEGRLHPDGVNGHDGGAAAFALVKPCCGTHTLLCRGRVTHLHAFEYARCERCDVASPLSAFRFVEL